MASRASNGGNHVHDEQQDSNLDAVRVAREELRIATCDQMDQILLGVLDGIGEQRGDSQDERPNHTATDRKHAQAHRRP